jgi:hypothetical protein
VLFLESVGVTLVAALLTACWHALAQNEKPDPRELAVGFDVVVAAMVLQAGFIPGSKGLEVGLRWAGVALLFIILTAMGVATKFFGYEESPSLYRKVMKGKRTTYEPMERMTSSAAWITSIAGCVVLGTLWWLNVDIGFVVSEWRGLLH